MKKCLKGDWLLEYAEVSRGSRSTLWFQNSLLVSGLSFSCKHTCSCVDGDVCLNFCILPITGFMKGLVAALPSNSFRCKGTHQGVLLLFQFFISLNEKVFSTFFQRTCCQMFGNSKLIDCCNWRMKKSVVGAGCETVPSVFNKRLNETSLPSVSHACLPECYDISHYPIQSGPYGLVQSHSIAKFRPCNPGLADVAGYEVWRDFLRPDRCFAFSLCSL